jgi:NAD(P)H-hydrate repair Nnr-like enzyme with NAD(P)H-hydrate dehydratase domain
MKKITQIPVLAPQLADGHKRMFGKILIVGGSVEFSVGYGASFEGLAALLAMLKRLGLRCQRRQYRQWLRRSLLSQFD